SRAVAFSGSVTRPCRARLWSDSAMSRGAAAVASGLASHITTSQPAREKTFAHERPISPTPPSPIVGIVVSPCVHHWNEGSKCREAQQVSRWVTSRRGDQSPHPCRKGHPSGPSRFYECDACRERTIVPSPRACGEKGYC